MEPLLLSSSSLKAFKDCRKSYQLMYEMMLDPNTTNLAVEQGSEFHKYMELAAKGQWEPSEYTESDMAEVAKVYLENNPLPDGILMVEEPFFVEIIPGVQVRCTFDLVYDTGIAIRGRDYKTFDRSPVFDVDLDFQGRFYIAALQRRFPDRYVEFEYENVRRTPPGIPHNKKGDCWALEECYLNIPLVIAKHEIDTLWKETQWVAEDLVRARKEGRWYRQDRKTWAGCESCFVRDLCKAEVQNGRLDEQTIALLSSPRAPLDESYRIAQERAAGNLRAST